VKKTVSLVSLQLRVSFEYIALPTYRPSMLLRGEHEDRENECGCQQNLNDCTK
jgi:hypothetical protein